MENVGLKEEGVGPKKDKVEDCCAVVCFLTAKWQPRDSGATLFERV